MTDSAIRILEWTPAYAVHVQEIDRDHQHLFDLVNRLHAAMLEGKGKDILGQLLSETASYTLGHFAAEEKLMTAARYPGLGEHVKQHDALRAKAGTFLERFRRGEATMTIEFTLFLSEWLRQHTMGTDREMGAYLNGNRGAPR